MSARRGIISVAAAGIALALSGAVTTGVAQAAESKPAHSEGMSAMNHANGMSGMMVGPHHVLAMAYRDNVMTFARAVRGQATKSAVVDLDLARPAVAEMRRSLDQMQLQHQAQMAMMGASTTPPSADAMKHMTSHLTSVTEHLTALEAELNASTPDPKRVTEHANGILKECDGMTPSAVKAKVHPSK